MTVLVLRRHRCQRSVSGTLRFYRIDFSQVLFSLDPHDSVVQFCCVPVDEKNTHLLQIAEFRYRYFIIKIDPRTKAYATNEQLLDGFVIKFTQLIMLLL